MIKKSIIVKTQFEALHAWENCPIESVSFLAHPHRHIFYVKVKMPVQHSDRHLEFFKVKQQLDVIVKSMILDKGKIQHTQGNVYDYLGSMSCEMMAEYVWSALETYYEITPASVEVSEDNENSAILEYVRD